MVAGHRGSRGALIHGRELDWETCAMYAVLHQCLRADAFPVAESLRYDAGRRASRI